MLMRTLNLFREKGENFFFQNFPLCNACECKIHRCLSAIDNTHVVDVERNNITNYAYIRIPTD